ncbi:unnamed protein product, partial [Ectocarpus fasciculatus]
VPQARLGKPRRETVKLGWKFGSLTAHNPRAFGFAKNMKRTLALLY